MTKHGFIILVTLILALANLSNACLAPVVYPGRFKIDNEVEGFEYEGYVIWSPKNCSNYVTRYGPSFGNSPPYRVDVPSECSKSIALDSVSAKISSRYETIYCEASLEQLGTWHSAHGI